MVLLARKDEEGNTQTLYDHLHGAGRLASGFEDEFADISRTAAVLHDVGKVAQQFQTYLLSDDGHRGDVQHARQGAFVVNDFFESKGEIEEIAKEILELAISKHHGGLPDCIDESGNRAFLLGFTESDKSNEKYAYQEIKRGLNGLALDLQSNFRGSAEDIACFLKKIKSLGMSKDSIYFYLGLLVKLIYSRLVDADRTDAACFETRKQYRPNTVDWQNLISRLDKSMRSFDSSSEINRIRHQINEQCCLAGARETGIYRLSIPTGGGKTLASLNFALHHALKTGKHRIIYVIPYLSITTQTAKTFRDVLGLNADSDVLLEHYSTAGMQRSADVADNASSEFEDAGEHQRKLAAERWDNPIIVTTMVEFLETVMSARGTKLRKFHNMADSVIIFDEIQSLPMNTINLFNEIVSFLSKITNSTILLCSATQPLLEKTKRENLLLSEKPDLIAETESYEDKLRRTRIDDVQITKSVNSETTDSGKKSSDTMGMKYRVSGRAVYVTYGSISPQLAERTGFSAEDAEKIKEALVTLFENDESSARPSGSMEVLDVVWFAHNCKGGQYSSAKVHRSVSVDADGTVNVDDASIPGLRYEVIEGR